MGSRLVHSGCDEFSLQTGSTYENNEAMATMDGISLSRQFRKRQRVISCDDQLLLTAEDNEVGCQKIFAFEKIPILVKQNRNNTLDSNLLMITGFFAVSVLFELN